MWRPRIVDFDGNPLVILIISCFGYRNVFDVAFVIDKVSRHQKRPFQSRRRASINNFHDFQAGAIGANIEY